jgi:predicted CopG family antitoxin
MKRIYVTEDVYEMLVRHCLERGKTLRGISREASRLLAEALSRKTAAVGDLVPFLGAGTAAPEQAASPSGSARDVAQGDGIAGKGKTIHVSEDTWRLLMLLKYRTGAKTVEDVLRLALDRMLRAQGGG